MTNEQVELLGEEILEKGRQLKKLRAESAKAKKAEKELRDEILAAMAASVAQAEETGEKVQVLTASGQPVFNLSPSSRAGLDKDRLQARYPEVYEECLVESTSITLGIDLDD